MATVGSLVVDLRGNTATFARDMGKAQSILRGSVSRMQRDVQSLQAGFGSLSRAAGAFGVGLSVAGLVSFTRHALEAAGDLGELATQLGLSTDALQTYRFAASQSGVSNEELEGAFIRLRNSIGEAENGSKTAIDAFNRLGVNILDASNKGRSGEQVFRDIAEAYKNSGNKAQFAADAQDLMGRTIQRLFPLMENGKQGLDDMSKAASKLSDEQIAAADHAADAWKALDHQWELTSQTLVVKLAPAIETVLGAMTQLLSLDFSNLENFRKIAELGSIVTTHNAGAFLPGGIFGPTPQNEAAAGAIGSQAGSLFSASAAAAAGPGTHNPPPKSTGGAAHTSELTKMIAELQREVEVSGLVDTARAEREAILKAEAAALEDYKNKLRGSAELTDAERASVLNSVDTIQQNTQSLQDQTAAQEFAISVLQQQLQILEQIEPMQQAYADTIAGLNQLLADGTITQLQYNAALADLERQQKTESLGFVNDLLSQQRSILEAARTPAEAYADAIAKLNGMLARGEIDQQQFNAAVAAAGTVMTDAEQKAKDAANAGKEFGDAIGTAFEDAIIQGDSLRDVLRGLEQDLIRIILRMSFTSPLQDFFSTGSTSGFYDNPITSLLGSLFGAGTNGSVMSGAFGMDVFAEGGRPPLGVPSIVGERGPEVFWPDQAGTIIPNDALSALKVPEPNNGRMFGDIHVHVPPGQDAKGFRQAAGALGASIARQMRAHEKRFG